MLHVGESFKNCLYLLMMRFNLIFFLVVVKEILHDGGDKKNVYKVKSLKDSKLYVIKTIRISKDSNKQTFEELIKCWKDLSEKTSYVVKYYDHLYSEDYVYILMEYCACGDLSQEIARRVKENRKFKEKVMLL
jgi:serine/threonine protein kinase